MPQELGWRPAQDQQGGFDVVSDENPFPVQIIRTPPQTHGPPNWPQPFSFPLAGSVSILLRPAAGFLNSIMVSNVNAAIRYLQIFNQTTAPASTQVPIFSFPIGAGSATVPGVLILGIDILGPEGLYLSSGIAIGVSTAAATFTAATAGEHAVAGTYS